MSMLGNAGVLQVTPPAQLEQQLQQRATANAQAQDAANAPPKQDVSSLASYIWGQFEIFRNHRNTQSGWSERMLQALRAFNGQYDPQKTQEVRRFGGSEIYARLAAAKCRAASSLLRDVYLGADRPWALRPPADPDVPQNIMQAIEALIATEKQMMQQHGQQPGATDEQDRYMALLGSARDAAKKKAKEQTDYAEDKVEEILREGGYYRALAEFIVDLPVFPFGVIKGPIVRIIPTVEWPQGGGQPIVRYKPKLTWTRVSPFDIWFTPGVGDIENANVIEKLRVTRAELNDLLDLPGYDQDELRAALNDYGRGGLYDNWDMTDAERAVLENRENPAWNRSAMINMMEFNGNVQGQTLQDYGLAVPDPLRDYHVQVWLIGPHVIKAHLSPSPRMRHPYFMTSFEKVPGTPIGNSLIDLLADVQEVSNATLRAMVNNLSMASGPQVVVNDDRLAPMENGEDMFPWKRWHVRNDPMGNSNQPPISFFMPNSNAQQLIQVLQYFDGLADTISAIPKYVGGEVSGGAGRTASGLAMLMGNSSKILQTVSANVDRDVIEPSMKQLIDLILLTDTSGLLTGDEEVSVQGVNVAIQRETLRQRQIEFLSATTNPVDQNIVGIKGRGQVLRSVSKTIGLDGDEIVPNDQQLEQMDQQHQKSQQGGPVAQTVEKGVQAGITAGVSKVVAEVIQSDLPGQVAEAAHAGAATATVTPPAPPGAPVTHSPIDLSHNNPVDMNQAAQQAQGTKPPQLSTNHMGPQTSLTGNQPGPRSVPIAGGVG